MTHRARLEIISRGSKRYDRKIKLEYYASIAVPEHWAIDREARSLEPLVCDPEKTRYVIAGAFEDDDVFAPESLEGLEIPLGKLSRLPVEPSERPERDDER